MMLRQVVPIVLEVLLFYFLIGHVLIRHLLPKRRKNALMVRDFLHHVRKLRTINSDILSPEAVEGLDTTISELNDFRTARDFDSDKTAKAITKADERVTDLVPPVLRKRGMTAEYLEILVVALGVAFGIRAVFFQPFKIPTGSMQPTLYGIHFVKDAQSSLPNPLMRVARFCHNSRRYVDITVGQTGLVRGLRPVKPRTPIVGALQSIFTPRTAVIIGNAEYLLPGKPVDAVKCNPKLAGWYSEIQRGRSVPVRFEAGEVLARGYLMSGDHVFVNRMALNFAEPKRGDITVFMTDGIYYGDLELRKKGRYYIKRLVGLPGDELRIDADGRLAVREPGATEFRAVDARDSEAFRRIYSGQGTYHGYVSDMGLTQRYLTSPEDTFVVPEDHYFMLGDNSRSSLDSRFWGAVPRRNLVGRAAMVWWPVTRRWGPADTVEPDTSYDEKTTSSGQVE